MQKNAHVWKILLNFSHYIYILFPRQLPEIVDIKTTYRKTIQLIYVSNMKH